jgi:anti-sigma B factor antagonist
MKVEISQRDGINIASITGATMGNDDKAWMTSVTDLMDGPNSRVILDLSGVSYLGSAGLGELVRLNAQANSMGAKMVLAALTPFVAGVLAATQLDKFFVTAATVDDAIASMRK